MFAVCACRAGIVRRVERAAAVGLLYLCPSASWVGVSGLLAVSFGQVLLSGGMFYKCKIMLIRWQEVTGRLKYMVRMLVAYAQFV